MAKDKTPVTPAVRLLRQEQVDFTAHPYTYEEKGGTAVSARELGVDEHAVIKTLIMEDDRRNPLIVLMHGDLQVSTRELARVIGARSITPAPPQHLREAGEHLEDEPARWRGGIYGLCGATQGYLRLHEPAVGVHHYKQRPTDPIQLVDQHHIEFPGLSVFQQFTPRWPLVQ